MVLPLIARNTQEALKTVPDSYRSGAIGLGAGKWHMIRTILLPSAMPGIITGVILAIGRIVGESAALLFTAGSSGLLPKNFTDLLAKAKMPAGTLTIQLYLECNEGGIRGSIWYCSSSFADCSLESTYLPKHWQRSLTSIADNDHLFKEFLKKQANVFGCFFC